MVSASVKSRWGRLRSKWNRTIRPRRRSSPPITGKVKWFDATRGFGFIVSDEIDGDVLIHFSVLRDHGRRSIPKARPSNASRSGSIAGCRPRRSCRSISLRPCRSSRARPFSSAERADRNALSDAAGEFEPVEVKWFNRVRGYGFVKRADEAGRRGCVRPHGNGAQRASARASARPEAARRGSRRAARD